MRRFLLALLIALPIHGLANAQSADPHASPKAAPTFESVAEAALAAMRARATELNIGGVAVVAYFEGDSIQSWSSRMIVVGRYKNDPTDTKKGSNLLAVVYAKAAEMADTHMDSGTTTRIPLTGEVGWKGGVISPCKSGFCIAAFSGGKSEEDVEVSHVGLARLKKD